MLSASEHLLLIRVHLVSETIIKCKINYPSHRSIDDLRRREVYKTAMKKNNIYKFLYTVSALLVLGFAISFGVDIYHYNTRCMGSAPLYAYALIRAVEFIVPSIIVFVAAIICKKKLSKNGDR